MKIIKNGVIFFLFCYIVGCSFLMGTEYANAKGKYPTLYYKNTIVTRNTLNKICNDKDCYLYFESKNVCRMKMCVLPYKKVSYLYNSKKQYLKLKNKYDFSYYSNNKGLIYAEKGTSENIVSDGSEDVSPSDPSETTTPTSQIVFDVSKSKEYLQDIRTILFILGCIISLMYGSVLGLYFKRPKGV